MNIKVQDNGQGIFRDILPRLFEKFATKSEIGTGLGLHISKNIVETHGGYIKGYNNPYKKVPLLNLFFQLKLSKINKCLI